MSDLGLTDRYTVQNHDKRESLMNLNLLNLVGKISSTFLQSITYTKI